MSLKKNIIAFFIISILGTVFHFAYSWSGNNTLAGLFFPVNESTWEHLKLIFFPTILYSVFEYLKLDNKPKNYIPATVISILFAMLITVTLYYTYKGILGFNIDFFNITIYYIAILFLIISRSKILKSNKFISDNSIAFFSIIFILLLLFFLVWSYNPPNINIFEPPMPV